jgi:hypothetical protein
MRCAHDADEQTLQQLISSVLLPAAEISFTQEQKVEMVLRSRENMRKKIKREIDEEEGCSQQKRTPNIE